MGKVPHTGSLAEHGAVDYLVNNAGRSIRRSLELSQDRFHDVERTMAVNFLAPVRLTMGLLPAMRAQRFGHVVNVVSWGVQLKAPKFSAYLASKTALDTWGRIAAREAYGACLGRQKTPGAPSDMMGAEFNGCRTALHQALAELGMDGDALAQLDRRLEALEAEIAEDS